MAICNLKGRVVASGWLLQDPDGIDLLIHTSLANRVTAFLKPYVTFSKCQLGDDNVGNSVLVNSPDDGIQLLPGLTVQVHRNALHLSDCSAAINTLLISNEFAFISHAVSEQFLPQVLALHERGAVDFDKGCYLGQEIVARTQFRGAVKRHLVRFTDADSPAVGDAWGDSGTVIAINELGQGLATVKTN
jgi:folate-binding protein YgfZ